MSASTPRPLAGLTILIVDNHQDTVTMFVEYLSSLGAAVIGSNTARAGLHIAATRPLDAVLVDLRMPGRDGWWFLGELRAARHGGAADVPVLAVSGERHHEQEAMLRGFAAFFSKPVDLDALTAHLATLLHRRR